MQSQLVIYLPNLEVFASVVAYLVHLFPIFYIDMKVYLLRFRHICHGISPMNNATT